MTQQIARVANDGLFSMVLIIDCTVSNCTFQAFLWRIMRHICKELKDIETAEDIDENGDSEWQFFEIEEGDVIILRFPR